LIDRTKRSAYAFAFGATSQAREQIHLLVLGDQPGNVCVAEHVVEHHHLAGDEGGTRLPTIPMLRLTDGSIERAGLQVIDPAPVRPLRKAGREPARDQFLEKVADALAVADPGKSSVLAPQAIAAMERHQCDESRLARREADGFEPADPIFERHRRQQTVRSVSSQDMWVPSFEPDTNVGAARGLVPERASGVTGSALPTMGFS
jgi:hypothetical protein